MALKVYALYFAALLLYIYFIYHHTTIQHKTHHGITVKHTNIEATTDILLHNNNYLLNNSGWMDNIICLLQKPTSYSVK